MKNKFKALIAAFVGLFAFSAVAVGVNAVEVTKTYEYDLSKWSSVSKNTAGNLTFTATDSNTSTTMDLKFTCSALSNESKYNSSDKYYQISIKSDGTSAKFAFEFTLLGTGTVTFTFNTGGGSKYVDLALDTNSATQISSGSTGTQTFSDLTAGTHTLNFTGTTSSGSNFKLYSFKITDVVDDSSTTNESLAVTAIDKIGTVAYTNACYTLISNATTAVNKCENPSAETISNYDTYLAAVSAFETLQTEKTTEFVNSVNSVGTVTSESKTSIDNAFAVYNGLIDVDKTNATVVSSYETLNNLNKEYVFTFGDKLTTVNFSNVDSSFLGGTAYESEVEFYNNDGKTIFGASKLASIEANGKSYNGVSYTHRFKTNGTIQIDETGKVACAFVVNATVSGKVKIVAVSGNSSSTRNIKVCKLVNNALEVVKDYGNIISGAGLAEYEVVIPGPGKYYIGSDTVLEESKSAGGINFYYAEFVENAYVNLQYQVNEAYTDSKGNDVAAGSQIRFVGTVNCLTAATLADATATLKLTLGNQAKDVEITTVYSSVAVSGNLTYAPAEGVYYVVFIISGLNDELLDGVVLTAQLDVTVGGTTYSSVVKSHTIA